MRRGAVWLAAALAVAPCAWGAPAPAPPTEAEAAQQAGEPQRLVERLLGDQGSPVRSLDPAIFIELSPVTASEPAVLLPPDQRESDAAPE